MKSDNTGLIEIRVTCFCLFIGHNPIKVIIFNVTLIVTDSRFIDKVATDDGIKSRLVA